MTKQVFPIYAFCKQKRYLHRYLGKLRTMKLSSFISRFQKLNAYLEEFPSNTEGQEIALLPADKVMDIINHSMPTTSKNNMIE